MTFPVNPTNGETYVSNGVIYTYNSSTNQWVGALPTSSGGGSMGAPSHFGRFTIRTQFTAQQHTSTVSSAPGGYFSYSGSQLTDNILDIASSSNFKEFFSDPSNYGNQIVAGTSPNPEFLNLPQFCSDEAYLSSNPTFDNGNGNYYCASEGYVRFTTDSGATFTTFFPPAAFFSGKIRLGQVGKYKIKVRHTCNITGSLNTGSIVMTHTLLLVDGQIKTNYADAASWEFNSNNVSNGLTSRLNASFDTILDVTSPNTEFSLGMLKIGRSTSNNIATSDNTFIVEIESLF
jgi:hypothetical protein